MKSDIKIQFIKFIGVGVINTIVSLSAIYLCMELGINYKLSNFIGYVVGVINSFLWNKLWIFKSHGKNIITEILFFFITFAICYMLQYVVLVFLAEKLELNKYISQLIAMACYTISNFILNKFLTFRNGKKN